MELTLWLFLLSERDIFRAAKSHLFFPYFTPNASYFTPILHLEAFYYSYLFIYLRLVKLAYILYKVYGSIVL